MVRRIGAVALLSVLLVGGVSGPVAARSAQEIEAAISDADERLAQAQGALDRHEALLDDANVIFLTRPDGVYPLDTRLLPAILDWIEVVMDGTEAEPGDLLDDEIAEAAMLVVSNGLEVLLDEDVRSGDGAAEVVAQALREVAASRAELEAEHRRLLAAREVIEAEITLLDAEVAALFPPAWVQMGGQSAIVERYGPWPDEDGYLFGPGVTENNQSIVILHEDEQGEQWLGETCFLMEDGLSYCQEYGEPWGTYVSVYEEITGGYRRYVISTGDYCDLKIDRNDPVEGHSGHYSCAEGPRFVVWPGGPLYEFPPEVLVLVTQD